MPPTRPRLEFRLHVPMRTSEVVKLDLIARRRDVPRAQVVRQAIREYLAREAVAEPAG